MTTIVAAKIGRVLERTSASLSSSFERLSSGSRINRASDDAAGLAISESLNIDTRVYSQGIRNISDGFSLTNVAESALQQLATITERITELATQSMNGSYSSSQRSAINSEAGALTEEFNRIIESTRYNGIALLAAPNQQLNIQVGYGSDILGVTLQGELVNNKGDGTFSAGGTFSSGSAPRAIEAVDINNDSIADLITADTGADTVSIHLGRGDGTFKTALSFVTGDGPHEVTTGDLNGDGHLDIMTADFLSNSVSVLLGNGDGSFKTRTQFTPGVSTRDIKLADFNGDSTLDAITVDTNDNTVSLLLGNGDGSFQAKSSYAVGWSPRVLQIGDLNGDGRLDIATANDGVGEVAVILGTGAGFSAPSYYNTGTATRSLALSDLNGDGVTDIVTADRGSNEVSVLIGRGNGTFKSSVGYAVAGGPRDVQVTDLNGDGYRDIIASNEFSTDAAVLFGNSDGSFKAASYVTVGADSRQTAIADFNGDGVKDFASVLDASSRVSLMFQGVRRVTQIEEVDLLSAAGAKEALTRMSELQNKVSRERASLGAFQSRLLVAARTLQTATHTGQEARSRILDADIAAEVSVSVAQRIRQEAGAMVLNRSKLSQELVLNLLR